MRRSSPTEPIRRVHGERPSNPSRALPGGIDMGYQDPDPFLLCDICRGLCGGSEGGERVGLKPKRDRELFSGASSSAGAAKRPQLQHQPFQHHQQQCRPGHLSRGFSSVRGRMILRATTARSRSPL
ncbi:uncharacterized protein M6B38_317240 [Iris pallida]|uniref:Uncharacterized protein n=1 Tax=Iris pallida TaxID=29817 RepID=A0AAX6HDU7_IRIPA|nr:uncharacterized protein M6B38_317240 [Iris pallida]